MGLSSRGNRQGEQSLEADGTTCIKVLVGKEMAPTLYSGWQWTKGVSVKLVLRDHIFMVLVSILATQVILLVFLEFFSW